MLKTLSIIYQPDKASCQLPPPPPLPHYIRLPMVWLALMRERDGAARLLSKNLLNRKMVAGNGFVFP